MRALAVLFFAVLMSGTAHAQSCSFSITAMNFGAIDVLSGAPSDATANMSIACTGGPRNGNIRVCPNIAEGSGGATTAARMLQGSGGSLLFNLYQEPARTTVWGSFLWAFAALPPTIDIETDTSGSGSDSRTIHGRVPPGQSGVATGIFTSTFTIVDVVIRYRNGTQTCRTNAGSWATGGATFTASATVAANCLVSAQNIDFGATGVLDAPVDAVGAISVACTQGAPYTVGLNGGLADAPPAARRMVKGGEAVTYGLYLDAARSVPWDDAPGATGGGTGDGDADTFPVYGRVPAQSTPSPGLYSDTVVVTVTY